MDRRAKIVSDSENLKEINGKTVFILRAITEDDEGIDDEDLPAFWVADESGKQWDVFPEDLRVVDMSADPDYVPTYKAYANGSRIMDLHPFVDGLLTAMYQ
mgnify:CR=1 FL=1